MQSAGARAVAGDDNGMSREAVLLQWERKIEAAERLEGERSESGAVARAAESDPAPRPAPRRFERAPESSETPPPAKPALQLVETATQPEPKRFERTPETAAAPGAERRTITITGQPTPARRRRSVVEAQIAQPDRIALWAFLLGLFLVAVAAGTAHA
jgi:hypothetical protein